MTGDKPFNLLDRQDSHKFYEERYSSGYMESWPDEKKQKIYETILSLKLPPSGDALDFGCGNGVMTEVIRKALPGWNVYGSDISAAAVSNASHHYPGCKFLTADEIRESGNTFDFLFTHHVLEHVYDLDPVLAEAASMLKQDSQMLHVLPCGNPGSFEQTVTTLRRDGTDPELGGRFFFEDEGHVRRLTTSQLAEKLSGFGFQLSSEYYSCQHHGAINWITASGPDFVRLFTAPEMAVDEAAAARLRAIRRQLLPVSMLRAFTKTVQRIRSKDNKTIKQYLFIVGSLLPYLLINPVNAYYTRKADKEWKQHKSENHGSEMFLNFSRTSL